MRVIRSNSREEWLEVRRNGIGASDAPVILGLSKYKSPFSLYHEKLGLEPPNAEEKEAAEWGLALEGPLSERFTRDAGRKTIAPPPHTVYQHDTIDWALASIDRWQEYPVPGVDARPIIVPLELKTANWVLDKEWKEEAPLAYQVQVQHQMWVTGSSVASIASLIGGQKFVWMDVERDDAFIEVLVKALTEFWQRCVDRNPPPVDASEQTQATLKRLYASETGDSISLGPDAIEWDERFQAVKEIIKKAEEEETLLKNKFLAAIGPATLGVLPNGVLYTLKQQTVKEHVVKQSTFRVLRRKGAK